MALARITCSAPQLPNQAKLLHLVAEARSLTIGFFFWLIKAIFWSGLHLGWGGNAAPNTS